MQYYNFKKKLATELGVETDLYIFVWAWKKHKMFAYSCSMQNICKYYNNKMKKKVREENINLKFYSK